MKKCTNCNSFYSNADIYCLKCNHRLVFIQDDEVPNVIDEYIKRHDHALCNPNKITTFNQKNKFKNTNASCLISCPACNRQVSNQAQSCPHCGHPINTKPKCPTCGSQDIKKISGTERGLSVWAWGAFSNKINKNWKCNKCGHTW